MPTFIVDVQDAAGNAAKEKVDAVSEEQARSILQNRYPLVLKVKKAGLSFDLASIEQLITSVTVKDKAIFSRQFAAMVNAGVAMVRCLGVLADQCSNSKLKKSLLEISKDVEQGNDLSSAMAKHPDCFDHLYVSMVEAGETGGVLDEVLNRLSKVLEDIARLQNQIKSAMAYPVVVGVLAIVIFLAMTMFLIPVFAGIFEEIGTDLPLLTKVMLEISKFLRSWKIVIPFIAAIVFVFAFRQYYKTPVGRLQIDKLKLKLPVFGDLVEKSAVARFTRVFGTLTRSGVPILDSLEIVRDIAGNQVIANSIDAARAEIQQGGMISLALQKDNVFPLIMLEVTCTSPFLIMKFSIISFGPSLLLSLPELEPLPAEYALTFSNFLALKF